MNEKTTIKNAAFWTVCAIAVGTLGATSGRAELVTNGGFCSGTPTACASSGGDSNGWTTSGSGDPYYTDTTSLTSNTYAAQIGAYYQDVNTILSPPYGSVIQGSISQSLTTVVGQQYTVTFLYGEYNANPSLSANNPVQCGEQNGCYLDPGNKTTSNDPSTNQWAQNNNLNALLGGTSVYSDSNFFTSAIAGPNNTDGGTSIGDYFLEEGTGTIIATGTSTTLEFDANDYQQSVIITDVSVTATPEPGTIGLLGSALLGLGLLGRRRGFFARG